MSMNKQTMEQALEALQEYIDKSIATVDARQQALIAIAALKEAIKQQGGPVIWITEGHLREVSNGNILNCYCAPEKDRFADVPLYTSAPTIPEGWQLVPIEPTPEMEEALRRAAGYHPRTVYADLLSAAPKGDK
jgi:hypothetical protein